MKTSGARLLCSLAWALSACGSAASYDYELPPPVAQEPQALAKIRGQTVGVSDADPDRVRIALIWFPVSPAPGKFQISQHVKERSSSVGFEVDIVQEPPPDAIGQADMMRFAQAELVIFEDLNNNKLLDIVPLGQRSPDRVLGRADGFRVWRLEAGLPASPEALGRKPVAQGWSFTYGPITGELGYDDCNPDPALGGKVSCHPSTKEPAQDVSLQDVILVKVSNIRTLQSYACKGFWGTTSDKTDKWPDTTPGWNSPEIRKRIANPEHWDGQSDGSSLDLPVAGRPVIPVCSPDKTVYTWEDCEPDPALCDTVFCHYGYGKRDLKDPLPENWPANCR